MVTFSLCMIVRDEEETLGRCLESVHGAVDEIIIVDTGSMDATKAVARAFTDKIFDFEWIDDFSAARNFSFSKASMDYIMWLDADDVIEPQELEKILQLKNKLGKNTEGRSIVQDKNTERLNIVSGSTEKHSGELKKSKSDSGQAAHTPRLIPEHDTGRLPDVIMMKYDIDFYEGKPVFSYYRERILRRAAGFVWEEPVHEVITPRGKVIYCDAAVSHRKIKASAGGRNKRIYEKNIKEGKPLSDRAIFYYARELYYTGEFEKAAERFLEFLKRPAGWIENKIEACLNLAQCFMKLGKTEAGKKWLFKSFDYGSPRAEILCELGTLYFESGNYNTAIFFYRAAVETPSDATCGGFFKEDYYGFIPLLQLCVCHYRLGNNGIEKERNMKLAREYNEKAAQIKPSHPSVLHNKQLFESLRG